MNYFELFEIPISLIINKNILTKKYYELSKLYHPDKFSNTNSIEIEIAENKTAEINKAYSILQKQDSIIYYILTLHNILNEEDKNQLSNDFLMKMMDLNEEIMELDANDKQAKEKIIDKIKNLNEIIELEIDYLKLSAKLVLSEEDLQTLKNYYLKKKYLSRIETI
jgi:molecular chaperone HscB